MGLFLEREPFSDIDQEGGLEDFLGEVEAEVMQEVLENDPVAQLHYVEFLSQSKGRGRKRKRAKMVRLVGWGRKRCREIKDDGSGGIDRLAEEVLGNSVPRDEVLREFLRRLEDLDKQRKIARGEK